MLPEGPYVARRRRTARGLAYELDAGGVPALAWTLHPFQLGGDVQLCDPSGEPILRVTTEDVTEWVDAPFTVVDEREEAVVGHLRWTLRSLVRRHWGLLDPEGVEVGTVAATSRFRSIVRARWLRVVPYRYAIRDPQGARLGDLRGSIRPGRAFTLDLSADGEESLDTRLALGACAIVDAAEFW